MCQFRILMQEAHVSHPPSQRTSDIYRSAQPLTDPPGFLKACQTIRFRLFEHRFGESTQFRHGA